VLTDSRQIIKRGNFGIFSHDDDRGRRLTIVNGRTRLLTTINNHILPFSSSSYYDRLFLQKLRAFAIVNDRSRVTFSRRNTVVIRCVEKGESLIVYDDLLWLTIVLRHVV
jgi:hypothetical protein